MSKFSGLGVSVEAPVRMDIYNPVTRQPLRNAETGETAYIDVLSSASKEGRAHERAVTDQIIRLGNRARLTADQIEANATEKAAKLTRGWSLVTLYGQPIDVPYSEMEARELYTAQPWVRDQVLSFADDLGNFPQGASQSS